MSTILHVSDSYLKKILHKLVLAHLVTSSSARGGGYVLARAPQDITLRDAYEALESLPSPQISDLPSKIFPNRAHTESVIHSLEKTLAAADECYLSQLSTVTLADLLVAREAENGSVDWSSRVPVQSI